MLQIKDHGRVREIQLDRPPANALNRELVDQLTGQLNEAADSCGAVVISGRPGMFSAGLDVPSLLQEDRDGMVEFWKSFAMLTRTIAFMPVPTVFALTGHCPAGGIVLALYGDYRIMSAGKFKTGMNEVQVGLVVSPVIKNAAVRLMGPHAAAKILVPGSMLSPEQALSIGLVDALAEDPEAVVREAIQYCDMLLSLPSNAMLATRSLVREDLHALFADGQAHVVDRFLELWFSEQTRQTLTEMVARLQNK
ncbi:MAG TPA: enoyl-CoA hydratase/isomerase family protein [Xanthomonadales bacterium]|nr:enoyl-CoA hydratase/isomerase family protein [Xanthomonadales bacterium]